MRFSGFFPFEWSLDLTGGEGHLAVEWTGCGPLAFGG